MVLAYLEGDADACVALIERAIGLNPGSAFVWLGCAAIRTVIGEPDAAIEPLETSMRLDPLGPYRSLQTTYMGLARFQQGRFADALPALKMLTQDTDHPSGPALLAATYGHLGQTRDGKDALARYRTMTLTPIDLYAQSIFRNPAHVKLLLDGIALAENGSTTDLADGGQTP